MRQFRSDAENIRDMRIAYTFLISLAAVCLILGIVSTRLGARLHANELADSYRALKLCSDALSEWETAGSDELRVNAALRFKDAAARLPSEVELEPLIGLADRMGTGADAAYTVRAFYDTFTLLAALDYTSSAEARTVIATTLDGVGDALMPEEAPTEGGAEKLLPPEVVAYSGKVVAKSIKAVFGTNAGTLEPVLADTGDVFVAENDNLRMTFSAEDGSLESFVFIRLGDTPTIELNDSERLGAALDFFLLNRRRKGAEAKISGELCGFLIADITAGDELYRTAVDKYGRVWSLVKVKR